MSKRREAGDIVWKTENAGFVGEASYIKIMPEDDEYASYCMMDCGDLDCREWSNLQHCDKDGNPLGGYAYHVSECQMMDCAPPRQLFLFEM